ncbi:MAG: hypothetical protein N7Q72_02230 [Spiroplasma sp. Tabriz.8]|nr:hypothetical protein [Spiroplasma sp. Tabriz.8]
MCRGRERERERERGCVVCSSWTRTREMFCLLLFEQVKCCLLFC